ncbi:esterase/lipase family protein [Ruania rhizosphaerae]|uniref:esterase/lipase family protein n=1 Tax=Ruania rhizosphaerae TaxID=1840413 RepID=UPI001359AF30|nr:alpha/beta hydrolase [Ruania rhizosphaerae]
MTTSMMPFARRVRRPVATRAAVLLLAAILLTAVGVGPVGAAPAAPAGPAEPGAPECTGSDLAHARIDPADTANDGSALTHVPLQDGSFVPVVLVHGWRGSVGTWDLHMDLSENATAEPGTSHRSFVGNLQDVPGVSVFTFDYEGVNTSWVTDPAIGPTLATHIACLHDAFDQDVIVIAHSMGGLATRQAFAEAPETAEMVSQVITYGTPNTGSDLGAAGVTTALALLAVNAAPDPDRTIRDLTGDAAVDLATGSQALAELPEWPEGLAVHALYGDTRIETHSLGLFAGAHPDGATVAMGDMIVPTSSATAEASTTDGVTCEYSYSLTRRAGEVVEELFQVLGTDRTRAGNPIGAQAPCFHGNLMRTLELHNAMLGYVVDDLEARAVPALDERAVPEDLRGQWCYRSDPDDCFSFAELMEEYPGSGFVNSGSGEVSANGSYPYEYCFQFDADGRCTAPLAGRGTYWLFPAGVPWDCEQEYPRTEAPESDQWEYLGGCNPDFSDQHDVSEDRLVRWANHPYSESLSFYDEEPWYRR